jgi:hypothetical protein
VQVQSSWFPLIDLNPGKFGDIYRMDPSEFVSTTQQVFCGGRDGSRLRVRVLSR